MRALVLALCLPLCGFGSCSRQMVKPEIQTITQRVPVAVPLWLTQEQHVPPMKDGTVYSREEQRRILLDIVSRYQFRMALIRGLPHD